MAGRFMLRHPEGELTLQILWIHAYNEFRTNASAPAPSATHKSAASLTSCSLVAFLMSLLVMLASLL